MLVTLNWLDAMGLGWRRRVDDGIEEWMLVWMGRGRRQSDRSGKYSLGCGRVCVQVFDDDRSGCRRADCSIIVVIVDIIEAAAGKLVDEWHNRIARWSIRTAHARHKQALEANGFSQIVQLQKQSWAVAQITTLASTAVWRRARANWCGRRTRFRTRLQTVADLLRSGRRWCRLSDRWQQVTQCQLANVEEGLTETPTVSIAAATDWIRHGKVLVLTSQ